MGDPTPAPGYETPSTTAPGGGEPAQGADVLTATAPTADAGPTAPAAPASPAGWGAPSQGPTLAGESDGATDRRRAFIQFGIAIALVVVGLVTTFAASGSGGGIIWTGAFLVAAGLLVRAVVSYRASVRSGASSVTRDRPLLAGAALVVAACLVAGVVAISTINESDKDAHASTGVGSCWKEGSGDMLTPVDCTHDHAYVGSKVVDDEAQCDDQAVGTVTSDDHRLLCLDPA